MEKPLLNALLASLYIALVSSLPQFGPRATIIEGSALAPMVMLSLLVLSVAIMGFLFFYRPIVLLIERKQREAVRFFLQTLGFFALITAVILSIIFGPILFSSF